MSKDEDEVTHGVRMTTHELAPGFPKGAVAWIPAKTDEPPLPGDLVMFKRKDGRRMFRYYVSEDDDTWSLQTLNPVRVEQFQKSEWPTTVRTVGVSYYLKDDPAKTVPA
jgi:hypothetical protein